MYRLLGGDNNRVTLILGWVLIALGLLLVSGKSGRLAGRFSDCGVRPR